MRSHPLSPIYHPTLDARAERKAGTHSNWLVRHGLGGIFFAFALLTLEPHRTCPPVVGMTRFATFGRVCLFHPVP